MATDQISGFGQGIAKSFGSDAIEESELGIYKQKESNLLDEAKRIDAMNANQLAQAGHDINDLKTINQRHLAEVRKEIARLSK